MSARTITSANSEFVLTFPSFLFPVAQRIQGYASDDAFTIEPYDVTETQMGVDGNLSGGYTPNPKKQSVILMADSLSLDVFDIWLGAIQATRETIIVEGTIVLPGTGKAYAMHRGFLTRAQALPPAKKVLQPQTYEITWQDVQTSILS